jgi:hypothetical protein
MVEAGNFGKDGWIVVRLISLVRNSSVAKASGSSRVPGFRASAEAPRQGMAPVSAKMLTIYLGQSGHYG